MEMVLAIVITSVVAAFLSVFVTNIYHKKVTDAKVGNADEKARKIIDEALKTAEEKKREALLEAKEENIKAQTDLDKEIEI